MIVIHRLFIYLYMCSSLSYVGHKYSSRLRYNILRVISVTRYIGLQ